MIYIDTSAFLKLVLDEPQSPALRAHLAQHGQPRLVSSALMRVEARRGVLRSGANRMPRADLLLQDVITIGVSDAVLEKASRLPDPLLRSLDAIHLATALMVRDDLDEVLTYDDRLADAATSHGLTVERPAATP